MRQRRLGQTGLHVSRLGLGTLTWGRDTDQHEARDQLAAFVEAGGTLVDTAASYADGAGEELLGSLLGDVVPRDDLVLATKAGSGQVRGRRAHDTSRGALLGTLDGSLRRLGVDHVDLWQVHVWHDGAPLEETLSALDHAVATGRARYVGVSNYTGWQTAWAASWQRAVPGRTPLASTQVEYSLLNRDVEEDVVPAARALGLGVLPVVPAGTRGADRQVPHRRCRPTPGRPPRTSGPTCRSTSTRAAVASSRRSAAPPTGSGCPRWRSRWPGYGTGQASPRRSSGARTAAQLRGALGVEDVELPDQIVEALDDVSGYPDEADVPPPAAAPTDPLVDR